MKSEDIKLIITSEPSPFDENSVQTEKSSEVQLSVDDAIIYTTAYREGYEEGYVFGYKQAIENMWNLELKVHDDMYNSLFNKRREFSNEFRKNKKGKD